MSANPGGYETKVEYDYGSVKAVVTQQNLDIDAITMIAKNIYEKTKTLPLNTDSEKMDAIKFANRISPEFSKSFPTVCSEIVLTKYFSEKCFREFLEHYAKNQHLIKDQDSYLIMSIGYLMLIFKENYPNATKKDIESHEMFVLTELKKLNDDFLKEYDTAKQ